MLTAAAAGAAAATAAAGAGCECEQSRTILLGFEFGLLTSNLNHIRQGRWVGMFTNDIPGVGECVSWNSPFSSCDQGPYVKDKPA